MLYDIILDILHLKKNTHSNKNVNFVFLKAIDVSKG